MIWRPRMIIEIDDIFCQVKNLFRTLWMVYATVAFLFVLIVILRIFYKIPIGYLTRDPADIIRHSQISSFPFFEEGIVNLPFYLGGLSYLGILFWCATMAICFFSYVIFRKTGKRTPDPLFFLLAGLITSLLLIDDLFRLHEIVFPVYLHLHEYTLYVSYAALIAFLLIRYRSTILSTDYVLLMFALGCLGFSLISDMLTDMFFRSVSGATLVEDGAKFVGIVSWFLYFARICFQDIVEVVTLDE